MLPYPKPSGKKGWRRLTLRAQLILDTIADNDNIGVEQHELTELIVRKGFHAGIDSYSAFRENDRMTRTGLDGYLKARGFTKLTICGLALDYCVAWTAIDGRQAGFDIAVVVEATAAIDLDGSRRRMLTEMRQGGINLNATA